jgi:NAD(P)H-dependent flavin oxidoreductase YrpB (nitropropane dioxygenase family)
MYRFQNISSSKRKAIDYMTPEIIQGGMGVYISTPFLANTVSRNGALGTVSGVAPERILARILGRGDVGGHYRRALSHFPFPKTAQQVLDAFYIEEGNPKGRQRKDAPFFTIHPPDILIALSICANYAFVWLAKEGHENPVSINYLEKIAMPHIYAITGAMLAGVDFITMGAGLPFGIPDVITAIIEGRTATYDVLVTGTNIHKCAMSFDPEKFFGAKLPPLKRPGFIPIVSSNTLAWAFTKKMRKGTIVNGIVIEEPSAGGHNAPPREGSQYGPEDEVDYSKIKKLLAEFNLPFWIGGSKASPEKLKWAQSVGAMGIQAGSIFALSEESGMDPGIRREARRRGFEGKFEVRTDMIASPTGFPFKVVILPGSLSEEVVLLGRNRVCNQGALRTLFEEPDGSIGYRCPAEPIDRYLAKGGKIEETKDVCCICNGLLSTAGLGDEDEAPIITMGDDVSFLSSLMSHSEDSYRVVDALTYLKG